MSVDFQRAHGASLRSTALACLTLTASLSATAADDGATLVAVAPSTTTFDAVTLTATRTPTRVSDVVAETTVIDRAALDRSAGRTLVEVLAQQPGLQFSSNGGLGKTGTVFIRGLEGRHTMLLVDGVRVSSATLNTPSLDNLPLESIERIEIVRGPLSSLYGSDAVGGVVQIFTRRGVQGFQPNAKATVGSNRYRQASAGAAFGSGAFDGAVQAQHTETRGFSATNPRVPFGSFNADDDGFVQDAGSLKLGWQLTPGWRVDGLALQSDGTSRYDDGPGVDARAKLHNRVLSLQAAGPIAEGIATKFSAAQSIDGYDTLSSASPFASLGEIETRQRQFGWETTVATPIGTALALLERIEQDVSRPGTPFAQSDRSIDAVALGLSGSAGAHDWQASVRRDRNSQFGNQTTGALGYGFEFLPRWRIAASAGTSFVAPSFNQLYFPGFGNPDLQPEEGKHREVSLRWGGEAQSVRLSWFDHRIRGYISSGPAPTNIPRTRIDGVSLAYEALLGTSVSLAASIDHLDARNATTGTANEGKLLPRRAKNSAKAELAWSLGTVNVGGTLLAYSERYDNAANTTRLPGYATLDLHADWTLARDWTVGARLNNLADKAYETALGYNQPGREVYVSLRYAPR